MPLVREASEVINLNRLNQDGLDDLFICCASFEERCVTISQKMAPTFMARFAVIFAFEDNFHKRQADTNMFRLQSQLGRKTTDGVFVIRSQKGNPFEGITQLKAIWSRCRPRYQNKSFITIDISGFPKILILELLHYLVNELKLPLPRILHTTQEYLPTKLTQGVQQVTTVPDYFGTLSLEKKTVLVLFLGFEPERCLAVWKHFNPAKTILLITNPPRHENLNYLEYARTNNEYLLSRLLGKIPERYSTGTIKLACPDEVKFKVVYEITRYFSKRHDLLDIDGAKITFDSGWALVRASNTEACLTLRFEAVSRDKLDEIKAEVYDRISELLKL